MNFCNLGFIVGSTFAPFSEHVQETKQVVALIKSLKKNNPTIAGIIQASLIQNALSRCSAMSMSEGTMDGTSGMTIGYVGYFNGYFGSILFMSFEVQVWQMVLLMCLMVGIVCWTIIEVRGYKASLASWSELTDSMFEDDEDERRQAFASYSRWKRQQEDRTHWVARNLRSWFAGNPSDFDRQYGGDAQLDLPRTTGTQTDLEMPVVNRVMYEDTETQSEKEARYRRLNIEECSDVELWMSLHCTTMKTWMLMEQVKSLMFNLIPFLSSTICSVQGTEPFESMNNVDKRQSTETIWTHWMHWSAPMNGCIMCDYILAEGDMQLSYILVYVILLVLILLA